LWPAAALAEAAQSLHAAEFPGTEEGRPVKQRPLRRRHSDIVIEEVTPSWGDCKRYSHTMNQKHYDSLVAIARQIYDMILQSSDPRKFPQKNLQGELLSAITNKWLVFQNIKDAATNRNFSSVQIGHCADFVDPERKYNPLLLTFWDG
jgi:hypothetical protein